MAFARPIRKLQRNIQDYGWQIALRKSCARLVGSIYERRVYRIYKIDCQDRTWNEPVADTIEFRFIEKSDRDSIEQVEDMAEWLTGQVAGRLKRGDFCLGAFANEEVAGFNLINLRDAYIPLINMRRRMRRGEAWSEHIGVKKAYRKMGLAKQLRFGVLRELQHRGHKRLYGGLWRTIPRRYDSHDRWDSRNL